MIKEVLFTDNNVIMDIQSTFYEVYNQKNELINDFTHNPYTKVFVIIDNNNYIAMLHINHIFDRIEIININTIDLYRKKGYASNLLTYLLEYSKLNNVVNITLEVNINNSEAIKLYKKYGFVNKAIRKSYYNGIDAILMEKELIK